MPDGGPMLARVTASPVATELLAGMFEFDITATDPVEDARLASGMTLRTIAGDGSGGTYFVCGDRSVGPILYASSEGEAGLIATDLEAALELIVAVPQWRDCLKFSAGGSIDEMRWALTRLEHDMVVDNPALREQQAQLRQVLGLPQPSADELLTALHRSVTSTAPDFVLVGPHGAAYESLFNSFRVTDNPCWR